MPESSEHGQSPSEDEFVGRLVPDPTSIPDLRLLSGYPGRAAREGYWRLYLTADLQKYVEIAQQDVVFTEKLQATASSPSRTAVWIRRGAVLTEGQSESSKIQANFLSGGLLSRFMSRASIDATTGPIPPATTLRCFIDDPFSRDCRYHITGPSKFCPPSIYC